MSTKHCLLLVAGFLAVSSAIAAEGQAAAKAKELATTLCVTCHGADGVSQLDLYPNLARQKATYTAKQLKDFRDGNRKDPVMTSMAAQLDDAVIQALAEYFAGQARK